jgi:predicted DNA-binding protein (MmcQ/YjbR family)
MGGAGDAFDRLLAHALSYPEAREDHPWGETVVKVRRRVFVFFGRPDGGLSLSVKLPTSAPFAFDLPYCEPTGYGLGRAGWITARFRRSDPVPVEVLRRWIDESFRAVAPRKLHARIGGPTPDAAAKAAPVSRGSRGTGARPPGPRRPARSGRGRA